MTQAQTTVGVISDTHGVVRPEAIEALRGSELIIHAGDVGDPDVLERLRAIAPTVAVRGNVDNGPWAQTLWSAKSSGLATFWLYVLHRLEDLDLDPKTAGFAAVIYGHSHQPSSERRDGILFLNPGSAGPRRFRLPVAIAKIRVVGTNLSPEFIHLRV